MAEHRVSMLGGLRRFEDPAHSADPQIRAVVAGLRTLEVAPPPRAHFRAELRAQLVAVAPRLVAEGLAAEAPPLPRGVLTDKPRPLPRPVAEPSGVRRALGRLTHLPVARPLGIVTAVVAVFGLLLAGAVWVSQHALPGDALYGLKRASENVELSFDSTPEEKASDLLSFAKTRADEVSELLAQPTAMGGGPGDEAGGGISSRTAGLVKSTLDSANSDVTRASQLLGTAAVQNKSDKPLDIMTAWTPGQVDRLSTIVERIPTSSPLHQQAASSVSLVKAAQVRAAELMPRVTATCMTDSNSDKLGPVPCSTSVLPTLPTPSTTPARTHTHSRGSGNGSSAGNQGNDPGTNPAVGNTDPAITGGTGATSTGTTKPPITIPSITLPTLPIPSLSTPVKVDSCGLGISVGPIDIGIGPCGVHVKI